MYDFPLLRCPGDEPHGPHYVQRPDIGVTTDRSEAGPDPSVFVHPIPIFAQDPDRTVAERCPGYVAPGPDYDPSDFFPPQRPLELEG
jgi:hypothetical protein